MGVHLSRVLHYRSAILPQSLVQDSNPSPLLTRQALSPGELSRLGWPEVRSAWACRTLHRRSRVLVPPERIELPSPACKAGALPLDEGGMITIETEWALGLTHSQVSDQALNLPPELSLGDAHGIAIIHVTEVHFGDTAVTHDVRLISNHVVQEGFEPITGQFLRLVPLPLGYWTRVA